MTKDTHLGSGTSGIRTSAAWLWGPKETQPGRDSGRGEQGGAGAWRAGSTAQGRPPPCSAAQVLPGPVGLDPHPQPPAPPQAMRRSTGEGSGKRHGTGTGSDA